MKNILITGIGGAIGVHMLKAVMETTNMDVVGIDSFNHKGYLDRLNWLFDEHPHWHRRFTLIRHDLTAPLTTRQVEKIGKVNYIVNLASLSDVQASIDDPVPFIRNNSEIMVSMLEYARQTKPDVFLQFSTDEVYGPASKHGAHPEWDTILPSNPYSASKAAQEAYAIAYWRSYDVPVIITNTMNNFGETQAPSKFPAMIQKQLNNHEQITIHAGSNQEMGSRYYIHSYQAALAVLFILKHLKPHHHQPGEIDRPDRYNIVGDKQLTNLELAKTIAALMHQPLDYRIINFHSSNPGHDLHYGLDGRKLKKLGWKQPKDFKTTMQDTIDWQQQHPEWMA